MAATRVSPAEPTGFSHASASGGVECDGDNDVFAGTLNAVREHMYLNQGTGTLQAADTLLPAEYTSSWMFTTAEFCDLNRDAAPELVLGGWWWTSTASTTTGTDGTTCT